MKIFDTIVIVIQKNGSQKKIEEAFLVLNNLEHTVHW